MTFSISTTRRTRRAQTRGLSVFTYIDVWQQRRALAQMDAARLIDMGITPAQAAKEAARPFWDLPH